MTEPAANDSLQYSSPDIEKSAGKNNLKRIIAAPFLSLLSWAVPGLGHALLGKWGRGLALFATVAGLAVAGYWMRGEVFAPHSPDPFGTLGFLADSGSGVFYYAARLIETTGADVSRATGDYGTRFIAAAGVVNWIGMFDVFEIAMGRRA